METVLKRCKENDITISRKKLDLGNSIHFTGHIISDGDIRSDDDKFAALRNFQQPNTSRSYGSSWDSAPNSAPSSQALCA